MSLQVNARTLHPGTGTGRLLVLDEALSLWGGTDHHGVIIDEHHPQRGTRLDGTVLAMPGTRGSSSSSSVLAEQLRRGTAPAALILAAPDAILVAGAWVAAQLYGRGIPVVEIDPADLDHLPAGATVTVTAQPGDDDAVTIS